MGRMNEEQAAPLEEHLLICEVCQSRLAAIDEFLAVARAAAPLVEKAGLSKRSPPRGGIWNIPHPGWALSALALLVILAGTETVKRHLETDVTLSTTRGAAVFPRARAGEWIVLHVDVTEILRADGYQLEVVDPEGQPIWHAIAEADGNQVTALVRKRLEAGRYWVRLYDTGRPWTLLREYGLDVE